MALSIGRRAAGSVGRLWTLFEDRSTMTTTTGRRGLSRCLSLFSCWTGCFGNMFPCLAAQPVQQPQMPLVPLIDVGNSIPRRRSFSTDEEYETALEQWRKDEINILTTHMQTSLVNNTMTPDLMDHLKSEIERINFSLKIINFQTPRARRDKKI